MEFISATIQVPADNVASDAPSTAAAEEAVAEQQQQAVAAKVATTNWEETADVWDERSLPANGGECGLPQAVAGKN